MRKKKKKIIPPSTDPEIIALEKLIEDKLYKHGICAAFVRVTKKHGGTIEYSICGASDDVAKANALLKSKPLADL